MINNDSSRTHQSKSTSPMGRYKPRTPKVEPPTMANGMPVDLNNLQRIIPNNDNLKTNSSINNKTKITDISEVAPLPRMIDDELDSGELISGREDFPSRNRAISPQNFAVVHPEPLSSSSSQTDLTLPKTILEQKPTTPPIIFPSIPLSPQPVLTQQFSPKPTNISLSKASNSIRRKKDISETSISETSINEKIGEPIKNNDGLKIRSVSPTRNNVKKTTSLSINNFNVEISKVRDNSIINEMSIATPIARRTEKVIELDKSNNRRDKQNGDRRTREIGLASEDRKNDSDNINQSSDNLWSSSSIESVTQKNGRRRRGLSPIGNRYNDYEEVEEERHNQGRRNQGRYYEEDRRSGSRRRKTNRRRNRERIYEEDNLEKIPPISDWYHTLRPNRPDFSRMSPGQRYKERNKLLGKYDQLRQLGPTFKIPDPPNHWTLEEIYDDYEAWLKKCFLGKKISSYTKYLYTSLLLVEKIGTRFLGLPMKGFMASQQQEIASYQLLLMEMGESIGASVNSKGVVVATGSTWPVTVRLGLTLLGNTVMFIIIKLAIKWFGATPVKKLIDMFRDESGSKIANIELNDSDEPGKLNVGNDNADKFINQLSNTVELVDKISGNDTESKPRRRRRERLANPEFDE